MKEEVGASVAHMPGRFDRAFGEPTKNRWKQFPSILVFTLCPTKRSDCINDVVGLFVGELGETGDEFLVPSFWFMVDRRRAPCGVLSSWSLVHGLPEKNVRMESTTCRACSSDNSG